MPCREHPVRRGDMARICVLLTANGEVEPLPNGTRPSDVLQGPFHSVSLQHYLKGWDLTWSSYSYHVNEVNHCASVAAGYTVKGDVCLVNRSGRDGDVSVLLGCKSIPCKAPPAGCLDQSPHALCAQQRIVTAQETLARILGRTEASTCSVPRAKRRAIDSATLPLQPTPTPASERHAVGPPGAAAPPPAARPPVLDVAAVAPPAAAAPSPPGGGSKPGSRLTSCDLQSPYKRQHTAGDVAASGPASPACALPTAVTHAEWDDLPSCILGKIAQSVGESVAPLMPVLSSCRSWRVAALENAELLAHLRFAIDAARPFKGDHTLPPAAVRAYLRERSCHPRLLDRAAKQGNVSAAVAKAQLLDAAGEAEDGMRWWKRAAKGGHVQGQLLLGLALYRGTCGCAQDAEDAHLWLMRAVRQVQAIAEAPVASGCGQPGNEKSLCAPANSAASDGHDAAAGASEALRRTVLGQAGLILGYMAHDGEGVKKDAQDAVRWFRLAASHGCKEAEQVLGWIFNTGQFG